MDQLERDYQEVPGGRVRILAARRQLQLRKVEVKASEDKLPGCLIMNVNSTSAVDKPEFFFVAVREVWVSEAK